MRLGTGCYGRPMRILRLFTLLMLAQALGCGDDDRVGDASTPIDSGSTVGPDAGPGTVDSGPPAMTDGGPVAMDGGPPAMTDGGPVATDGGPVGSTGAIAGNVSRSASAVPEADGVGPLYVAVFDQDPVTNRATATVVARVLVEGADLSSATATIPYAVEGIPPRAEAYYVTAFFDDDMNAGSDPATAGPDRGDLVSLMGLGSPRVTVSGATTVDFDIVLNTALLFDP